MLETQQNPKQQRQQLEKEKCTSKQKEEWKKNPRKLETTKKGCGMQTTQVEPPSKTLTRASEKPRRQGKKSTKTVEVW